MAGGQLGIVEKTGKNDLQTEADRYNDKAPVAAQRIQEFYSPLGTGNCNLYQSSK